VGISAEWLYWYQADIDKFSKGSLELSLNILPEDKIFIGAYPVYDNPPQLKILASPQVQPPIA
jgi:hypothetical protein